MLKIKFKITTIKTSPFKKKKPQKMSRRLWVKTRNEANINPKTIYDVLKVQGILLSKKKYRGFCIIINVK